MTPAGAGLLTCAKQRKNENEIKIIV